MTHPLQTVESLGARYSLDMGRAQRVAVTATQLFLRELRAAVRRMRVSNMLKGGIT